MQNLKKIYHQEVTQKLIARFETDRETDKQRRRVDKSIGKKDSEDSEKNLEKVGVWLLLLEEALMLLILVVRKER